MNEQLQTLLDYTQARLWTARLTLSPHGIAEITKRWKLPENQGGFSNYWKGTK